MFGYVPAKDRKSKNCLGYDLTQYEEEADSRVDLINRPRKWTLKSPETWTRDG